MDRFTSFSEICSALNSGDVSSLEITQFCLDLIEKENATYNAYISTNRERALAQATQADERRTTGATTWITGAPIAHKDIFCTQGEVTSCGSHMLENFVAPYDATVVAQLNDAGVVTLGKTNMDEFAMGSSNENSYFGPAKNPWDTTRVPGGSSGGSAAAVAAGLAPIATGTDTGGSIRQPAAFCGLTGLKPTYGRVSRYGMVAFASSLDQGGPMGRSALDSALLFSYMCGFDAKDSTSADREDKWLAELKHSATMPTVDHLKIGLPQQYWHDFTGGQAMDALRQTLESLGHECVDVSLPHTDAAIAAYYVIAGAEASTNLSRYDGVRFGYRCENPQDLEDLYRRSRSEGLGAEVKRRILTGTYALSVGYYDAYYLKAQKIRRLIADDFAHAFSTVDVLLAPTTPTPAFPIGELNKNPVAMYQQDKFTVPISLAGLPALSLPCGFDNQLPLGAQLIAPAFREDTLLALAHVYQQETNWHTQHPKDAT